MPRKVDYPHCSFEDALNIAKVVEKVGGNADLGVIADELKMKETGGGFKAKINGATKYGMIRKEGSNLVLTELADKYFHPIDPDDKENALFASFTSVPLYNELVKKFQGRKVEKKTLESLLIRMYNVNRNVASKVAWYFLKANSKYNFLEMDFQSRGHISEDETDVSDEEIDHSRKLDSRVSGRSIGMNSDLFELILNLGNLLYGKEENSTDKSIEIVKNVLEKQKAELSHSELFIDLLNAENKTVIEKLKQALMKDFNIKMEEREAKSQDSDSSEEEKSE